MGATGLVGQEFIKVLQQRRFPIKELRLLASEKSSGKRISFAGREIEVRETTKDSFRGVDVALFSSGTEVSLHFAPLATKAGAVVIDNSAAWRMDPSVPLVVPEVNPADCAKHEGIIANPNCSTIQMVVALTRSIGSTQSSVSSSIHISRSREPEALPSRSRVGRLD